MKLSSLDTILMTHKSYSFYILLLLLLWLAPVSKISTGGKIMYMQKLMKNFEFKHPLFITLFFFLIKTSKGVQSNSLSLNQVK